MLLTPGFERHQSCLQNSRNDILEVKTSMRNIAEEASAAMAQFKKVRDEYSANAIENSNEFEDIARLISTWRLLCVPNSLDQPGDDLPAMVLSLYEAMVKLNRLKEAVQLKDNNPHITLSEACKILGAINEPVLNIHENHRYVDSRGEVIGVAASLLDSIQLQTQVLYQSWLNMDLNNILSRMPDPNDELSDNAKSPYSARTTTAANLKNDLMHALRVYLKLVSKQPNFLNGLIRDGISNARGRFWRRSLNDALMDDKSSSPVPSTVAWISKMLKSEMNFAEDLIFKSIQSDCFCHACGTGYNESKSNQRCNVRLELQDEEFNSEKDYLIYLIDTELLETIDGILAAGLASSAGESVSEVLINRLLLNKLVEEQANRVGEVLGPKTQLVSTLRRVQLSINDAYDTQLDDICSRIQKVSHANLFTSPIVSESLTLMQQLKEVPYNCDLVNMTCDRILNILVKVAQRNDLTPVEQIQLYDYIGQSIKDLESPFSPILQTLLAELSEVYTKSSSQAYLASYNLDEYIGNSGLTDPLDEDQLFSRLYLFYQSTFADKFMIPELNKLSKDLAGNLQRMIRCNLNEVYVELHAQLSETYKSNLPSCL